MSSTRSRRLKKKKTARKPKFISLRNHLSPLQVQHPAELTADPEVERLLEQSYNEPEGAAATISDIFGSSISSSSSVVFDHHHHQDVLSPSPASSPSVEWDGGGLARMALRGRERSMFCSSDEGAVARKGLVLSLKLDYEEILTAWSDRGSLYIDGEGPQVVPQLTRHIGYEDGHNNLAPNVFVEVGNSGGWNVPEMEGGEGKEQSNSKINRRERVMRYKEKRQSRLFSKKIRYQVRKLNAEKRPRIKGRFVKRVEDV